MSVAAMSINTAATWRMLMKCIIANTVKISIYWLRTKES